jgi:hypothetical protein
MQENSVREVLDVTQKKVLDVTEDITQEEVVDVTENATQKKVIDVTEKSQNEATKIGESLHEEVSETLKLGLGDDIIETSSYADNNTTPSAVKTSPPTPELVNVPPLPATGPPTPEEQTLTEEREVDQQAIIVEEKDRERKPSRIPRMIQSVPKGLDSIPDLEGPEKGSREAEAAVKERERAFSPERRPSRISFETML